MGSKYLILLSLLASCTKQPVEPNATCHFVFDKIYQWFPANPTDTTYFLWMAKDTLAYPMGSPAGHYYKLQVSKTTYDTIILPRLTKYCY